MTGPTLSIGELLHLRDEVGVLSVYVGIDPAAEASPRPPWEIRIHHDLRAITGRLRAEGDHARRVAFAERLEALAPTLERMVDADEPGRGRALFAGVDSGEVRRVAVQTALPTAATLGEIAHVVPLLSVDDGHPRPLILVGRNAVRVLEARLGRASELQAFDVEPVVYDGAERAGPTASNPLRGQQVSTQRERWERHVEADHRHRLARAAEAVSRLAVARSWETGVVAGDPREAHTVLDALREAGVEAESVDLDLVKLSVAEALEALAPMLDALAERRQLALVRHTRDAAAAGGHAATGLESVLAALELGLVRQLLLDGERRLAGAVADGRLVASQGSVPADPQFADHLIQKALDAGARATIVGGASAAALADCDGVAAVLRARSAAAPPATTETAR